MTERILNWSAGISFVLTLSLIAAAAFDIGTSYGALITGATLFSYVVLYLIWKAAGEPGKEEQASMLPPGGLALVVVAVCALATPSIVRAEVDCLWSEIECRAETECGWDAQRHIHRCVPVSKMVTRKTEDAVRCVMEHESVCPSDRPREYHACLHEVRTHNAMCVQEQTMLACTNAQSVADWACRPEERGGVFDRQIAESVAACGRARNTAAEACRISPRTPSQHMQKHDDAQRESSW